MRGGVEGVPMVSEKWCLRYLEGRAVGFTQGNLSVRHVNGAVRMCLAKGISLDRIAEILRLFDLVWDAVKASVEPLLPDSRRAFPSATSLSGSSDGLPFLAIPFSQPPDRVPT